MKDLPTSSLRGGLERRYKECLTIEPGFKLVVALHDYIQYLNDHKVIDYLFIEKIQKPARLLQEEGIKAQVKAEKELTDTHKKLQKIVKEQDINEPNINIHFVEYDNYSSGRYISSRGKIEPLYEELAGIIVILANSEHKELVSHYISQPTPQRNWIVVERAKVSESLVLNESLRNKFQRQSEVSAWGAFDVIYKSYQAIKAYAYPTPESLEPKRGFNDTVFIASALEELKSGGSHSESAKGFFFHDYSTALLGRLQLALLDELDKFDLLKNKDEVKLEVRGIEPVSSIPNPDLQPEVAEEDGQGYFKLNKNSSRILVGKTSTRGYRLIKTLIFPLSTPRTVDSIFENIKNTKDAKDGKLASPITSHQRKIEIITWAVKELQKIKGLQGHIRVRYTNDNRQAAYLEVF